ncbi:hypothetical protein HPB49_000777 [Dermacentor silvarum]|uniref:Uncharacterized protein n=1 Tax=Dermacentor silvarum TaxID=543639 RepID=A0ACB8D1P9_DERSI|nr:hypothetical protein HPB49_000777 [Dermacentor silvarum]
MTTPMQDKRISCADALSHPYLEEGRLRYHSCMCRCCQSTPAGRHYVADFEPVAPHAFDDSFETELLSVHQVKGSAWGQCVCFVPAFSLEVFDGGASFGAASVAPPMGVTRAPSPAPPVTLAVASLGGPKAAAATAASPTRHSPLRSPLSPPSPPIYNGGTAPSGPPVAAPLLSQPAARHSQHQCGLAAVDCLSLSRTHARD